MKKLISNLLTMASLLVTLSNSYANEDLKNYVEIKPSPEVSFDELQDLFGFNVENADGINQMLLLGIGMDHTTPNSPNFKHEIGIPFIVARGPEYWVNRLVNEDFEIEVLVNNALLLLFSKEEIRKAEITAYKLLKKASEFGYWPADYYVSDYNITNYLSAESMDGKFPSLNTTNSAIKEIAKETMSKLNGCAEVGFAPCQYRLGFWLASSQKQLKDGLSVLKTAIHTTMTDKRYRGLMDTSLILAAKEIVMKGDLAGIDYKVREKYLKLMQDHINMIKEVSETKTLKIADDILNSSKASS